MKGITMLSALAALAYLAFAGATTDPSPVTAGAQEAPSMGPAVAAKIIDVDNRKPELADPPAVEGIYWRTDLEAAKREAAERKKPLVRLVTNVATCAPCRLLESGPLSDQETIRWLNRNVVMTQRLPRAGETIPFVEVQVRPNVWRQVRIATYKTGAFLSWFREAVR